MAASHSGRGSPDLDRLCGQRLGGAHAAAGGAVARQLEGLARSGAGPALWECRGARLHRVRRAAAGAQLLFFRCTRGTWHPPRAVVCELGSVAAERRASCCLPWAGARDVFEPEWGWYGGGAGSAPAQCLLFALLISVILLRSSTKLLHVIGQAWRLIDIRTKNTRTFM